jgi:hypothetical protein
LPGTEPPPRPAKQGIFGALAQRGNRRIPTKPLIPWWAWEDSNLQPDRYERRIFLNHPSEMPNFVEFHLKSVAFILVVSGAKQGR